MHSQETYEWIERYLAGACSSKEAAELEAKAAADPELMALIELHRDFETTIADGEALEFSAALAQADADYHQNLNHSADNDGANDADRGENSNTDAKVRSVNWRAWGIAASIAILVGIGGFFILNGNKKAAPEALFVEYFSPSLAPGNFRSGEDAIDKTYREAFDAYNAKDFKTAAIGFEKVYKLDPRQNTAGFYLGLSLLSSEETQRAISTFEGLASRPNTFSAQSKWYLALAWLKQGQAEKAKPYLLETAKKTGKNQASAKEILDQLD